MELENGAKPKDLILRLKGRVGSSGEAFLGPYKLEGSSLAVLVNSRNIHMLDGVDITLRDGDQITLMLF